MCDVLTFHMYATYTLFRTGLTKKPEIKNNVLKITKENYLQTPL